jgi:hypothetical protein
MNIVKGVSVKTDIESAFRLIPIHPGDYEPLGMFWQARGNIIMTRSYPLAFEAPRLFSINFLMP